jgi:hypothetical protein
VNDTAEADMIRRLAAAVLTLALAGSPTFANGPGFFDDEEHEIKGALYFGSIKDERGRTLEGALVRIAVKDGGEFVYKTGPFGRYKTDFVGLDVDPRQVDVSVSKDGYTLLTRDRRTRTMRAGAPVEINFVLKANGR